MEQDFNVFKVNLFQGLSAADLDAIASSFMISPGSTATVLSNALVNSGRLTELGSPEDDKTCATLRAIGHNSIAGKIVGFHERKHRSGAAPTLCDHVHMPAKGAAMRGPITVDAHLLIFVAKLLEADSVIAEFRQQGVFLQPVEGHELFVLQGTMEIQNIHRSARRIGITLAFPHAQGPVLSMMYLGWLLSRKSNVHSCFDKDFSHLISIGIVGGLSGEAGMNVGDVAFCEKAHFVEQGRKFPQKHVSDHMEASIRCIDDASWRVWFDRSEKESMNGIYSDIQLKALQVEEKYCAVLKKATLKRVHFVSGSSVEEAPSHFLNNANKEYHIDAKAVDMEAFSIIKFCNFNSIQCLGVVKAISDVSGADEAAENRAFRKAVTPVVVLVATSWAFKWVREFFSK